MSTGGDAQLPVREVADAVLSGLRDAGRVVLAAPTGSGKSTQVPQIIHDSGRVAGEVVVLEPRRLATRLLARRVAAERGVPVGEEVGYQMRMESRVSAATVIRFVTEGVFVRQLLADPLAEGVGCVIFDEFHERNLNGDLALACVLRLLGRRSDLGVVVMSATLDVAEVSRYLGGCPVVEAGGRAYPVAIEYAGAGSGPLPAPVWERAATAFGRLAGEGGAGDVLVFMPGAFEIRRTVDAIGRLAAACGYDLLPLHGDMTPEAQERAVAPGPRPKVIVATNVAETSITIEGVRAVIDSGLARIADYDPRRGVNSLLVQPVSRSSAEQRAGRAGRTGPGRCVRLWSEREHAARADHERPEVLRMDLSEAFLLLLAGGIADLEDFPWPTPPSPEATIRAVGLLRDLGALDRRGSLTPVGRAMARLPLHPRYARLLAEAAGRGVLAEAALIAALAQGRPVYRAARTADIRRRQEREIEDRADLRSDWFVQLRAYEFARSVRFDRDACEALGIHGNAARLCGESARQIVSLCGGLVRSDIQAPGDPGAELCRCLLAGFSDHLARRSGRGTRRCDLVHGKRGELGRESVVDTELLVASEVEERKLRGTVDLLLGRATAIEEAWLAELFPGDFSDGVVTRYDADLKRVVARVERRFRDLVLGAGAGRDPDPHEAARLLAEEVAAGRLRLKHWNSAVENWIARVNFVARHCPESGVEPFDEEARRLIVEQLCAGATGYKDIRERSVMPVVGEWTGPEMARYVDYFAPAEFELPRRRRPVRLRYEEDGRVVIASKLQDFYDVRNDDLRVGDGRVPLTIELLAPNGRPAHITDDLDGFWDGAYRHVRKELAGRYPKHEWR